MRHAPCPLAQQRLSRVTPYIPSFLACLEWGLSLERAAQVGCTVAAYVVERVGTQEYSFTPDAFAGRLGDAYGDAPAAEVG